MDAFSNASKTFGLKINIKKTEVLYQSNSIRTREEDIMNDGNKLNSVLVWRNFWNSPTLEAIYQVMDALTMKYRGGWPRIVHPLADYARDSGTGHLMRMSPDRLPKQILYSQLTSGHRKRGHPLLRFKDTIKRNLKLRDIKTDSWVSLSQQRDKWRATVK